MLYSPEAHEQLVDEAWNAERARAAITAIVADTERAFDDGWSTHARTCWSPTTRPRASGRSTSAAPASSRPCTARPARLRRARAGLCPLPRTVARCPADFPEEDSERSLWNGETGVRLVLQRPRALPGEPRAAGGAHRREPAGRAVRADVGQPGHDPRGPRARLDVRASIEWLQAQRDAEASDAAAPRKAQPLHRSGARVRRLRARARRRRRRHGDAEPFAVEEDGLVNWRTYAGMRLDGNRDGLIRTQWCHGAPGIVATLAPFLDEEPAVAAASDVACGAAAEGRGALPRDRGQRLRLPGAARAHGRRALAGARARHSRCTSGPVERGRAHVRPRPRHRPLPRTASRAASAPPSTSRTASRAASPAPARRGAPARLRAVIDRSLYGQEHVRRYRETDGEVGYIWNGAPTLLLTTTGRRTGEPATTPLIFGRDGTTTSSSPPRRSRASRLVPQPRQAARGRAAGAGRPLPRAGPDRRGRGAAELWRRMAEIWPHYDTYATRTDREIPVVVVERLRALSATFPRKAGRETRPAATPFRHHHVVTSAGGGVAALLGRRAPPQQHHDPGDDDRGREHAERDPAPLRAREPVLVLRGGGGAGRGRAGRAHAGRRRDRLGDRR